MEQIWHEHKTESKGIGSPELIAALEQYRNQIQQRCQVLQRKRNKVVDDVAFLKNMDESLEANKEPLKRKIRLLQNQRKEIAKVRKKVSKIRHKFATCIFPLRRFPNKTLLIPRI
jgi:seryl-tRNA synthetase